MKKSYLCLTILLSIQLLFAQEYFETLPDNPDPKKCFAKCVVPDEYSEEVITVNFKPEYRKLEVVQAVYETQYKEVIISPESVRFVYVPEVYETVVDTIWIKDDFHKLIVYPAEFERDYENVEIKPATGNWVVGEKDPDCPSINKANCHIFHYVENPAVFREIPIQKLKANETKTAEEIEGNCYPFTMP
jgi:hypothetical protein